ncbi:hypothetical protein SNE40_010451 [Patella caerulea]
MRGKPVTALPGISVNYGKKLAAKGFGKADTVLGKFLMLDKQEEAFKCWLKDTCAANCKQQNDCYMCLKDWCDAFF